MITFCIEKAENPEVCIILDADGIERLRSLLASLSAAPDHIHLMTEEWGGVDLSDGRIDAKYDLINSVRIVRK
jgi:hypothetical protein